MLQRGPEESKRISFAIFISEHATVFNAQSACYNLTLPQVNTQGVLARRLVAEQASLSSLASLAVFRDQLVALNLANQALPANFASLGPALDRVVKAQPLLENDFSC